MGDPCPRNHIRAVRWFELTVLTSNQHLMDALCRLREPTSGQTDDFQYHNCCTGNAHSLFDLPYANWSFKVRVIDLWMEKKFHS